MSTATLVAFTLVILYATRKFLSYRRAVEGIDHFPGDTYLLSRALVIANLTRKIKYIVTGDNIFFVEKHKPYAKLGWDVNSHRYLIPNIKIVMTVADPHIIKDITNSRARFPKATQVYEALNFYGRNIISTEGEEWKKYRKICAPAFNDRNNALVWSESVKTVEAMFKDHWKNADVTTVNNCVDITLPIALFVIGSAGFGREISWLHDDLTPEGYTMTFKQALSIVSEGTIIKLIVPDMLMGTTALTRKLRQAMTELRRHMMDIIQERSTTDKVQRYDLLSGLMDANGDAFDMTKLTDEELLGNVYIFLLAGHETTAHTLAFTFGLLALYQDEQEKLFEHIKSVIPDGNNPTYEQMPLLTYSLAVFYETLRLFPPAVAVPKTTSEDTTITATHISGETRTIPIPEGTDFELNIVGLHYNPRYWKEPERFNPSRFLEDWPRDAFIPFSAGARACIGRKFFESEGIAILTMIVSHFKITVAEEPKFAHESFEQRKARVLSAHDGITLTPNRVPLTFTRR
ncbi:hypothetical protein D9619_003403 [Psilocybe cf. subviscida]|uniref:Cytochrome P450 n=1 Tax=Psilocybe cf. subviscida TaxID=2480587 RepID=A0A8H5AXH8_9AGAR|nr:hypothetical protein D9619_003403 [Psilocybe cf. subviscida]